MALVPNMKDSRWLTLEVCREFQRSKCSRTDDECKYAHPPPHVEIQNGRVTCCYDSIKGKCNRREPPCKYLHPPQQLKEVLLQNGRNNLMLKNIHMQMMTGVPTPIMSSGLSSALPNGLVPMQVHPSYLQNAAAVQGASLTSPYLSAAQAASMAQLQPSAALYQTLDPSSLMAAAVQPASNGTLTVVQTSAGNSGSQQQQPSGGSQKLLRSDRLEASSTGSGSSSVGGDGAGEPVQLWTTAGSPPAAAGSTFAVNPYSHSALAAAAAAAASPMSALYFQPQMVDVLNTAAVAKKRQRDPTEDLFLSVGGMSAYPGGALIKRTALADMKSGLPFYQPAAAVAASPYQQTAALTALQYQPTFVPMSLTGHPPTLQRF